MNVPDELVEIGAKANCDAGAEAHHMRWEGYLAQASDPNLRDWEREGMQEIVNQRRLEAREVITAILPHLYKMMLEPTNVMLGSTHNALAAYLGDSLGISDRDVSASVWKAMLASLFKEKFGLEIEN